VKWWKKKDDTLVPVSRPAHWSFGLYCGGSSSLVWSGALIVLSGLPKKCLEDDMDDDDDSDEDDIVKDDMAITYHDDLQLIKDVVRPCQNAGLIHL
jgi:hypothetical protein